MTNVRVLGRRSAVVAVALALWSCGGGGSTSEPGPSGPKAPTGLTATASSSTAIALSWTDASSDEDGFRIERATAVSGPFQEAGTVGVGVTTWNATGLAASTEYFFRVVAVTSARESAPSHVASATTRAALLSRVSVHEVSLPGFPQLGQGMVVQISFAPAILPVFEENPALPTGCKVWTLTPSEASAAEIGEDQGTVQLTVGDGAPAFPPCTWTAGTGYRCVARAGTAGTISSYAAGVFVFNNPNTTFAAADVGRYLTIAGATNSVNNGSFPIVAMADANTVLFGSGASSAEALPASATWTVTAGEGPVPGTPDPGYLGDGDTLSVELANGGNLGIDAFTSTALDVGDDFTLDTASATLISNIPIDGSAFSLGCGGAGGTCNTAAGTVLTIITTDGTIPGGAPPWFMPAAVTTSVQVQCASVGATSVSVPVAVSAYLSNSGAKRIEARLSRTSVTYPATNEPVTVAAGHVAVGFTTTPPP